ncbi:MAG: bifunctional DNA primase/polymerase [Legionellaceae bacterium]|nr:bifunctional DNA primase/polymerase [Legionellaceae bacterium]
MTTLAKVWSQIDTLLQDGLSLIPVRDKQEGDRAPKTPYNLWKRYQTVRITKDELWTEMESKETSAVAIVCGTISGYLEVVDVDVKYNAGVSAVLFSQLQNIYPELFAKLRIHKTPSGGYHILYRIANSQGAFPGNLKLAGRPATEQELIEAPKTKTYNFLETRGEGGYILCPPSMGYEVYADNPIPLISWDDRCNIINICRSLTEIIEVKASVKPSKSQSDFYSTNPFDDFNQRADIASILEEHGWKVAPSHSSKYLYFTRPDKKGGVSASFHQEHRVFWSFSTSTEFQETKGYSPVGVLLQIQFNGDTKALYRHLVNHGYGSVKPKVEESVVRRAAVSGKPIPPNFSTEAQAQYQLISQQLKEDHPFGIFIKYDEDDKLSVSRESLYYVANNLGFRFHQGELVRIQDFKIAKVNERYFQDTLKAYIREEDADEYEKLCNVYEAFLQKNGSFTINRLQQLDNSLILSDTIDAAYKFFQNGYLVITAQDITFNSYENFAYLVWEDKIQPRNYSEVTGGKFVEYIKLAVIDPVQAQKVFGYLTHEYKDETTGFIVVLIEQCADPKQGGGSGKNVFCNLLKLSTTYTSKPGAQAKFDEKFFQSWNGQRVFGISDVSKNFNFEFLKEPSTGSFIHKKLFKDEIEIGVNEAPKFIVQTNYSYEITDGGLKRRIIPLEFTDFFTRCGGLDVHFGSHFPNGWSEDDYAGYDNFVAEGIQLWLQGGRKLHPTGLTETGWLKQWEQTYGNATGFIQENWEKWITDGFITHSHFQTSLESYYNENNIQKHYWPSSKRMNDAIESYCNKHGVTYEKNKSRKEFGGVVKARYFYKNGTDAPEDEEFPF